MATPKNRFELNDEKQAYKVKDANKEMGWGARLDQLHEKGNESKNRFGDLIVARPEPIPVEPTVQPTYTRGGVRLDPATLAAKEAADASRQNIRDNKARVARDEAIGSLITETDFQAILIHFSHTHPATYWSLFNLTNITNVLLTCLQNKNVNGVTGLNSASLETVYQWMIQQNNPHLFEPAPGNRRRGEMAARKVDYTYDPQTEQTNQRVIQRTVVSREENQALRAMDFEELKQKATAGFKPSGRKV